MLVARQLQMNAIEPSELSMRVPLGMRIDLAMSFIKADESPVDYDPLARLMLTGRSGGGTLEYPVVSTDVTNGKGTAHIPAGALTDVEGYRVRMFGTISGRDTLIGLGTVRIIDGPID